MTKSERIKNYIKLCKLNYTSKEIMEELNVSRRTLTSYAKESGVKPKKIIRKANVDENYFEKIDTEDKAYILGFIFADGYIESHERALTFNISKKDIDILYTIKKFTKCGNEIRKSSTKNCIRLYISSKKIVNDLKKLGVTRNKSLSINFPKLDGNLYRHFLRGYFDGDGHIGKRQCVVVIGSKFFLDGFDDLVFKKFNKSVYRSNMGNYYRVQLNRCDVDIIKWIYQDSSVYLNRKYNEYLTHWSNYTPKG